MGGPDDVYRSVLERQIARVALDESNPVVGSGCSASLPQKSFRVVYSDKLCSTFGQEVREETVPAADINDGMPIDDGYAPDNGPKVIGKRCVQRRKARCVGRYLIFHGRARSRTAIRNEAG